MSFKFKPCTQHKTKTHSTTCIVWQIQPSVHIIIFIVSEKNKEGHWMFPVRSQILNPVLNWVINNPWDCLETVPVTLKSCHTNRQLPKPLFTNKQPGSKRSNTAFYDMQNHMQTHYEPYEPVSTWGCCISCSVTGTVSVASPGMAAGGKQRLFVNATSTLKNRTEAAWNWLETLL